MANTLELHTKEYSDTEQENFLQSVFKKYVKAKKQPHNGLEIDINYLTGKSIEFKRSFTLMLIVKKQYKNSMVYNYSVRVLTKLKLIILKNDIIYKKNF